jgi:hypothetical protein
MANSKDMQRYIEQAQQFMVEYGKVGASAD